LLLDYYKWLPSGRLLDALLSMLVDGKFEINEKTTIKASMLEPVQHDIIIAESILLLCASFLYYSHNSFLNLFPRMRMLLYYF
jgi:hypothetical protein